MTLKISCVYVFPCWREDFLGDFVGEESGESRGLRDDLAGETGALLRRVKVGGDWSGRLTVLRKFKLFLSFNLKCGRKSIFLTNIYWMEEEESVFLKNELILVIK